MKTVDIMLPYKLLVAHATPPKKSSNGAAGFDLRATDAATNHDEGYLEMGTGIAVAIPPGYVGKLYARSSISNTPHFLRNHVGVIDSDYRGEIKFRFGILDNIHSPEYEVGDKIGQLVIEKIPDVQMFEVAELPPTERGSGGFGSTGK